MKFFKGFVFFIRIYVKLLFGASEEMKIVLLLHLCDACLQKLSFKSNFVKKLSLLLPVSLNFTEAAASHEQKFKFELGA